MQYGVLLQKIIFVLSSIQGYKIPLKNYIDQKQIPNNRNFSKTEIQSLEVELNKLYKIGAIQSTKNVKGQFISTYFLVPKPNGSDRFILNLKKFNDFVITEHFKMEDIRTAINILEKNDFMCSIDLKDAYFLIPVSQSDRKYLRFIYNGTTYEFTCLPFGLSTCPYVYTKTMKVVLVYLRKLGIRITNYLDDFLIFGRTIKECVNNVEKTKRVLMDLGFIINFSKSELEPKRRCKHLGVIIDSEKMTIELTSSKKENLKKTIEKILKKKCCKYEELLSLIGTMVAACPAVKSGWLYYKELERIKCLQGPIALCNKQKIVWLSNLALKDLEWWNENILMTTNDIRDFKFDKEIFSDASLSGLCAIYQNENARGFWKIEEKSFHINFLELLAAFLALQSIAKNDHDCQILLRIDNIVAISYIYKMGGIKFPYLNNITRRIWEWCGKRNIWIFAEYVASKENPADYESRIINIDTEWELADYAFNEIVREFGNPYIDRY